MTLRHFSEAFMPLLPGMTTVPLWVIPKPHLDKLQMVIDQSAGEHSPNSYISPDNACIHLDMLHILCTTGLKVWECSPGPI